MLTSEEWELVFLLKMQVRSFVCEAKNIDEKDGGDEVWV